MTRTIFRVWRADHGTTFEDAETITASDSESAAVRWAERADCRSADYSILGGSPAEVSVARDEEGAPIERFRVSGRTEPVYSARKLS